MPFKKVFFEAQNWFSTKTLLLEHYYRRQGGTVLEFQSRQIFKTAIRRCHVYSAFVKNDDLLEPPKPEKVTF